MTLSRHILEQPAILHMLSSPLLAVSLTAVCAISEQPSYASYTYDNVLAVRLTTTAVTVPFTLLVPSLTACPDITRPEQPGPFILLPLLIASHRCWRYGYDQRAAYTRVLSPCLSEVRSDGNTCPEVITRTYQIADHCGNLATATHLIAIDDNVNPTLTRPASLTAVCDISEQPAYTTYAEFTAAGGTASDNCGIDEGSFTC